jgi:drug/metabolite transporter (DMT)-like permease
MVEPVLSPLWAWLLHGEAPGALAVLGGAILTVATVARALGERGAAAAA